jgi:plasmid replication initiation protein
MNKEKQVTQYKNQVNTIPMRNWTAEEMNFFFAVLTKLRDEGTKEIVMDKYQLAELAQYSVTHNKRYRDTIKSLVDKIGTLTYIEETKNSYESMPLFLKFKATWEDDLTNMQLILKVNPDFEYILNRWNEGNWTKFLLEEFIKIESTYSKTLFRLLKQWKTVGKREFTLDEFKKLMDIPKSYQNGIINHRIINNSIKDLEPHFKDLKVKTIKANTRGNPVIGYKFTWDPEQTNAWEQDKFNKIPSKKQTYKTGKKKPYRSKNGSIEAKKFAERAREKRFARMMEEQRKEEQGQSGEEILQEIRKEEGENGGE